jgi:hypothetical protein
MEETGAGWRRFSTGAQPDGVSLAFMISSEHMRPFYNRIIRQNHPLTESFKKKLGPRETCFS